MSLTDKNYETLVISIDDPADRVATIAISRPEARNALNRTVRDELMDAVPTAEADDNVRVLVITGSNESGSFVAGADVAELGERDILEQREMSKRPRVYEIVDDADLPVIACVNGHCLGGGCELAMACDVRIAEEGSKLGQPEINLGIIPGGGGTQRLPRLVGEGQAMRLVLSGELVDADEARDIGLVDEVCESENLDDCVANLTGAIAEKSPVALEFAKKAVSAASKMDLDQGIEYEAELFTQLFATEDKREGVEAFFEDREPEFTGH